MPGYNPAGTTYVAQVASDSDVDIIVASSVTANLSATFSGLSTGTSYYPVVYAQNGDGIATAEVFFGNLLTSAAPATNLNPPGSGITVNTFKPPKFQLASSWGPLMLMTYG